MKDKLYGAKSKPTVILKGVKMKNGDIKDELQCNFVNNIYISKYSHDCGNNMSLVIIEYQVTSEEFECVDIAEDLIVQYENKFSNDGSIFTQAECYKNMRSKLSTYQLSYDEVTTFYKVFTNDYVKDSVVKKELNNIIDKNIKREFNEQLRCIGQSIRESNNNLSVDFYEICSILYDVFNGKLEDNLKNKYK